MAFNFCPNCGNKLDGEPKFCTNCGYALTGGQSKNSESLASSVLQKPSFNVNIPVPDTVTKSSGLNRYFKEENIIEYKRAMGLATGIENIVVAKIANRGKVLLFGALAELFSHWYILSFEDEGIVMIGLNKMNYCNWKNVFIPAKDITNVGIRKGLEKKILTIVYSRRKLELYINKFLLGCSYQYQNCNNLDNLVSKYK